MTVDPATVTVHPLAQLLPSMNEAEFRVLKDAIAVDGQQEPARMYQGMLLDGRHRCRACRELGLPLKIEPLAAEALDPLTYVVSANRHWRELSPSQRAAVGAAMRQHLSLPLNAKRIVKLRETLRRKRVAECFPRLGNTQEPAQDRISAEAIAADLMGVSHGYVGQAVRLQKDAPALFAQVLAGTLSLPAAMRQFDGVADAESAAQVRSVRTRFGAALRRARTNPELLARLSRFLDELDQAGA